jgi:hypothetical protein
MVTNEDHLFASKNKWDKNLRFSSLGGLINEHLSKTKIAEPWVTSSYASTANDVGILKARQSIISDWKPEEFLSLRISSKTCISSRQQKTTLLGRLSVVAICLIRSCLGYPSDALGSGVSRIRLENSQPLCFWHTDERPARNKIPCCLCPAFNPQA